jgi:hypothetical protein
VEIGEAKTIVAVSGLIDPISELFQNRVLSLEEGKRVFFWESRRVISEFAGTNYATSLYENFFNKVIRKTLDFHGMNDIRNCVDGVILITIDHPEISNKDILSQFELETIIVSVKAPDIDIYPGSPSNQKNRYVNELVKKIRKAVRRGERVLRYIKKEVTSNDNKTPLLLPEKNFGEEKIRLLSQGIRVAVNEENFTLKIKALLDDFRASEKKKKIEKKLCFRNSHLVFVSPGRNRHGAMSGELDDHWHVCMFRGYFRFGAPYDPRFHYDCLPISKRGFCKEWLSCHGQDFHLPNGRRHINISPNDNLR